MGPESLAFEWEEWPRLSRTGELYNHITLRWDFVQPQASGCHQMTRARHTASNQAGS